MHRLISTTRSFSRILLFVGALVAGSDGSSGMAAGLTIAWTNNMLNVRGPDLPGGSVDIWYLEAFCRSGSTHRDWSQTTIPHRIRVLTLDPSGKRIRLLTEVEPKVTVLHDIRAGEDEVDFRLVIENKGEAFADVQWFQPCMRVDRFTQRTQQDYWKRSFIFTQSGLTMLHATHRTVDALYRGGQVYVPEGVDLNDVNPRPISPDRPVNGLIGCVSHDDRSFLAMAWDQTQELFQGVIVCLHNDPRVGGLKAGETKRLHGKVYVMKNDPKELLERYQRDFER